MTVPRILAAATFLCGVASGRGAAQSAPTTAERILAAALIPGLAADARAAGTPQKELVALLDVFRTKSVPASEAKVVLDEQVKGAREHGQVHNFSSFVQARLDEGLRGQRLAAAIRAEHAARGKGKPAVKAPEGKRAAAPDPDRKDGRPDGGVKLRKPDAPDSVREFRQGNQRPIR